MNINCAYRCCQTNISSSYIKWLIEILAPVIMGSKPSEIINISFKDQLKAEKLSEIICHFDKCKRISYKIIDKKEKGVRVLFVNYNTLEKILDNKKVLSFLKFLGYPKEYNIDTYFNIILNKLYQDNFPDEIGIFLGYPLKDVVGFMGYGKYQFYNTKSWQIYGDPTISENLYNEFLSHRKMMKELLVTNTPEHILEAI